jgi:hypothetical protein
LTHKAQGERGPNLHATVTLFCFVLCNIPAMDDHSTAIIETPAFSASSLEEDTIQGEFCTLDWGAMKQDIAALDEPEKNALDWKKLATLFSKHLKFTDGTTFSYYVNVGRLHIAKWESFVEHATQTPDTSVEGNERASIAVLRRRQAQSGFAEIMGKALRLPPDHPLADLLEEYELAALEGRAAELPELGGGLAELSFPLTPEDRALELPQQSPLTKDGRPIRTRFHHAPAALPGAGEEPASAGAAAHEAANGFRYQLEKNGQSTGSRNPYARIHEILEAHDKASGGNSSIER